MVWSVSASCRFGFRMKCWLVLQEKVASAEGILQISSQFNCINVHKAVHGACDGEAGETTLHFSPLFHIQTWKADAAAKGFEMFMFANELLPSIHDCLC